MVRRTALTRGRIVSAAVDVADLSGLTAVSMRNVGKNLGVEAMSLYHHIAGKEELLDELADWIFVQIELPAPEAPWRSAMAEHAASARRVLSGHPWALGLIESRRNPGPAVLRHHDAVLGCLRRNGFSVAMAAHAFSALDAYVYGFVLAELNLPFQTPDDAETVVADIDLAAETHPHLAEMVGELVLGKDYDYGEEFDYGLDLILEELDRRVNG